MADVPERPKTFFRISPAEPGEAQCFAVRRGDTNRRFDSEFHATPDIASIIEARYPNTQTIASFCEFIDSGKPISSRLCKDGIPAYEVGHVLQGELKDSEIFVSTGSDRILQRHDLITGRVGGLGAFSEYKSDLPASFSDNVLRLRPKEHDKPRAAFVAEYLNCSVGNRQLLRGSRGSLQKVITQRSLGDIIVPLLGQREEELVVAMDSARAKRKAKLAEADALLAGMDDFVLDALGLAPPQPDSRRVFAARPANLRGQVRLNSEYYHPERIAALRSLSTAASGLNIAPLAQIVSFAREQLKAPTETYLGLAHVQSHTGELTDSTDTASGACFVYQRNDVLFARLRPYLNKVHRAESGGTCSTEFHVLRITDSCALRPDYLAAILRSKVVLAQTVHMATGNTHPRLTNEDVANLAIPVPAPAVQERITAEVARRRQQARRLRAGAEAGWQATRQWFEVELLGAIAP